MRKPRRGKTPTIYDIKAAVEETPGEHHFFDRDILRRADQTLKMFTVKRSPKGRIFLYAPRYMKEGGRRIHAGYTFREYMDGQLLRVDEVGALFSGDAGKMLDYIASH